MKLVDKVALVSELIEKAKKDEVSAIEVDSTWETVYDFTSVKLGKRRLIVYYTEWNGAEVHPKCDQYPLSQKEDVVHVLNWIKRCIKKGYKEQNKNVAE